MVYDIHMQFLFNILIEFGVKVKFIPDTKNQFKRVPTNRA